MDWMFVWSRLQYFVEKHLHDTYYIINLTHYHLNVIAIIITDFGSQFLEHKKCTPVAYIKLIFISDISLLKFVPLSSLIKPCSFRLSRAVLLHKILVNSWIIRNIHFNIKSQYMLNWILYFGPQLILTGIAIFRRGYIRLVYDDTWRGVVIFIAHQCNNAVLIRFVTDLVDFIGKIQNNSTEIIASLTNNSVSMITFEYTW